MTYQESIKYWNRCDWCGRFIAIDAFDSGSGASREFIPPGINDAWESYETICAECNRERGKSGGADK